MTNDGWGNAWDKIVKPMQEQAKVVDIGWPCFKPASKEEVEAKWPEPVAVGWDLGKGDDKTILTKANKTHTELHKQGSNLVDDEGHLYFQCEGCEALFDPATKSFKTLHDFAHKQGWKVKWNTNGLGYKIYCVKCGEQNA